jgi:hypothetical protein
MLRTRTQIAKPLSQRFAENTRGTRNVIAWSSLAFAMLQSICTFFAAMNGLRVGIGISSFVLAAGTASAIDRFHVDWLRVPMMSLAVLYRYLRNRLHKLAEVEQFDSAAPNFREENLRNIKKRSF